MKSTIVKITEIDFSSDNNLYTSLEGENPGGSIKDHMVLGELQDLLKKGILKRGDLVAEASAGSTALSLAYYCKQLGLRCALFLPSHVAQERLQKLEELGSTLHVVEASQAYAFYEDFLKKVKAYPFNQLTDASKRRHYRTLSQSAMNTMGSIDMVFGAVGTGHSLLGVGGSVNPDPEIISCEPLQAGTILGVRNLDLEKYGSLDLLSPQDFTDRVIVNTQELGLTSSLTTSAGVVEIGDSFRLVLAAAKIILKNKRKRNVFLIGANNKRT